MIRDSFATLSMVPTEVRHLLAYGNQEVGALSFLMITPKSLRKSTWVLMLSRGLFSVLKDLHIFQRGRKELTISSFLK